MIQEIINQEKPTGGENRIKKPRTISNEEAKIIRKHLNHQDKLIFDLSIETGLRISDILKLKKREICKIMYIRESKTKKHKIIELSEQLYERLKTLKNDSSNYAFNSPILSDKHLHRVTYHRHLKFAARATGIACSAHSTRKLYAWNIFERNKNIFEVQKALNHKYITTTAAYLDIDLAGLIRDTVQQK